MDMGMDIWPETIEVATWPITADVDLAAATVTVRLGGEWRPAEWVAAATTAGGLWTRRARLLVRGAAAAAVPGSVLVVAADVAPLVRVRVTIGSEVIDRESTLRFRIRS